MTSTLHKFNTKGFAHQLLLPIIAVVAIASIGVYVLGQSKADTTATSTVKKKTVLVFGDSITSKYIGTTQYGKAWWKVFAEATGARIVFSAQGGSGYVRKGDFCRGTTFAGRVSDVKKYSPDYIIIEGGRNDGYRCTGDGKQLTGVSQAYIKSQVGSFLDALAKAAKAENIWIGNIYAFAPWGPEKRDVQRKVVPMIKQVVVAKGMHFADVPPFGKDMALADGLHPNAKGSRYLSDKLRSLTSLDDKLAGKYGPYIN